MSTTIQFLSTCIQANVPVIWWGPPGVGKTAILSGIGESLGFQSTVVISLATRAPEDVGGLPVPDSDNRAQFRRLMDPVFQKVAEEPTLLVVDELNRTSRATMNAALRGIQERAWGDLQMHPGSRIVATGNPSSIDPGAADLGSAMANRFCHVSDEPDLGQWFQWLLGGDGATAASAVLPANWETDSLPSARQLLVGFLTAKPTLVNGFPKDIVKQGGAWASRRSWSNAARLYAAAQSIGDNDLAFRLVAGTIGEGPALEFLAYCRDADLPNPADILANPLAFKLPARMDQHFAVLGSVVALARKLGDIPSFRACEHVLVEAYNQGARDVASSSVAMLMQGNQNMLSPKAAMAFMPTLQAAGIIGGNK